MFLRIEGFQVGFEIGLSLVGDVWASWASGPPRSSGPPLVSFTNPLAAGSGLVERTPKKVRFSL